MKNLIKGDRAFFRTANNDVSTENRHTNRSMGWLGAILALCAISSISYADKEHDHGPQQQATKGDIVQENCPVMTENKIDPGIYTEYQGKKVYFCCTFCRAAFQKEPEKYLHNLPQFAQPSSHDNHQEQTIAVSHDHNYEQSSKLPLIKFTKPMGIAAISLLILTGLMGIFRRRKPKLLLKWHKRLGITTLIVAIIHALLVLFTH
jgi:hypothetical protein